MLKGHYQYRLEDLSFYTLSSILLDSLSLFLVSSMGLPFPFSFSVPNKYRLKISIPLSKMRVPLPGENIFPKYLDQLTSPLTISQKKLCVRSILRQWLILKQLSLASKGKGRKISISLHISVLILLLDGCGGRSIFP